MDAIQYCIVTVLPQSGIVSTVYGPFDAQGCSAAYRLIRDDCERQGKRIYTRGIFPVAQQTETLRADTLDALRTEALGVAPGETRRIEIDLEEIA